MPLVRKSRWVQTARKAFQAKRVPNLQTMPRNSDLPLGVPPKETIWQRLRLQGTLPSNTRKLETTLVPNAKGTPRRVPCAPPPR